MYKRFKKVVSVVFIMISLFTLFGPVALANEISTGTVSEGIIDRINQTNDYIYKTIDKTVEEVEKEVLKINQSEQDLDQSIDMLGEKLIIKTDNIVTKLIDMAAGEGIEIIRTYIEVELYDRTILVDPCYAH